jgi:hypothetical protein
VELTILEKMVYSVPTSLDSRMEGRTQPRKPSSSTYPYVQQSLSSVLIKHSVASARFCSTTFTSYPQQQLLQFQNESSLKSTLLPAQRVPTPDNKPPQPLNNVEMQTFLTYVITLVPLQEIQLRSGKVLDRKRPSIVI